MKRLSMISILFLAACLLGCGSKASSKRPPVTLIPSNSLAAVSVKWSEIRKEPYFNKLINGDKIEKQLQSISVFDSEIDDLVVFSDRQITMNGTTGIILSGTYDQRKVISQVKKSGWVEETYRRHKIYVNPGDNVCVAILKSGLLVLGTRDTAQKVIDVEIDPAKGMIAKQPFDDLIANSLKQRRPISLFVSIPQELQDMANATLGFSSIALDLVGMGPLGELVDKIGYVKGLGCSISRKGESFPVELTAIMKDDNSASFISGSILMMKKFTANVPQDKMSESERQSFHSFQSMLVSRDENLLKIGIVIPEQKAMR